MLTTTIDEEYYFPRSQNKMVRKYESTEDSYSLLRILSSGREQILLVRVDAVLNRE